jgi:hypothetical protein
MTVWGCGRAFAGPVEPPPRARARASRVVLGALTETGVVLRIAPRRAVAIEFQVGVVPMLALENLAPTAPLKLEPLVEQATPHETMRFIPMGEELTLQSRLGDMGAYLSRRSASAA